MCNWGDTVPVIVTVPPDLSSTGKSKLKRAQIDRCIAPVVDALEIAGIHMRGSCCGHRKSEGYIHFQDGRVLLILPNRQVALRLRHSAGLGGADVEQEVEQEAHPDL